jgi:hypothetical protein
MKTAVGDEVRVHFHPPSLMKSYSEGVVRRINVTAAEGHFYVVEVTREVTLDRQLRYRPRFQDYVRYEGQNDFPGRIEILSPAEQGGMKTDQSNPDTGLIPVEAPDEIAQELEAEQEPCLVHLERHDVRRRGGLIAVPFGSQN